VALAEQISVGVVKNLLFLQYLMQEHSGRALKSIDPLVQQILAIGLYQIRFLTRVPASAAVDEAVEQTKRFGQPRAAGFVNAVLRKATRDGAPPLPDAEKNREAYARIVLSHPPDLFKRLSGLLGEADAVRFCRHDQMEPPIVVRMDDPAKFLAEAGVGQEVARDSEGYPTAAFAAGEVTLTPHEAKGMFVASGAKRAILAGWAEKGIAQVQDPTAAAVVGHARIEAGMTVLDRCAGLGTKTLQMWRAAGNAGRVLAMDPAEARCEGLRRLLRQRGIENVTVKGAGWLREIKEQADVPAMYDRVIADVPCSNSGVLARRPGARYQQTEKAIKSLGELQDRILDDSAAHVRAGGLLVYSTCSIWPEENQQRVQAFLKRHSEFEFMEEKATWPSFGEELREYHDGGYVGVMKRK